MTLTPLRSALFAVMFFSMFSGAEAETVVSRAKIPATGTPASVHWPECTAVNTAETLAKKIEKEGLNAVNKAGAALGLGSDITNTSRRNESECVDLCVVIPAGAQFTAKGSITPKDSVDVLPSNLPGQAGGGNWAGWRGPFNKQTSDKKQEVICYTAMNWSHNLERIAGIEVKY